jgi:hypothetical protein
MSAETALRALLVADGSVAALVGTRVSADRIEQGAALPFVVFARSASSPVTTLAGVVLITMSSLDVQCWADTRAGADALADAVTAAVRGVIGQSVPGRSGVYDADLDLHGTVLNVNWWA